MKKKKKWLDTEEKELEEDPIRQQKMREIENTIEILRNLASQQQNPKTKYKTKKEIAQLQRKLLAFNPLKQLDLEFEKLRGKQDQITEEVQRRTLARAEEYNEAEEAKEEEELNPTTAELVGGENFRNFIENQLSARYNVSEPEFLRATKEVHGYTPRPAAPATTAQPMERRYESQQANIPQVRRKTQPAYNAALATT